MAMRPLKIGVVMDPVEKIDIDKDTTFVLMLEAQRRGHAVYYMELDDLFLRGGTAHAQYRRIEVARAVPHYRFEAREEGPLEDFDAVLMRKDPPFDIRFFFATHLLSLIDERKCFVMNHPRGLREANEKLYALRFPEQIPQTLVSSDIRRLKDFMDELGGEMIVKPLDGAGGSGVFYLNTQDRNTNAILEMATDNGRKLIMAQRYLPEIRQGDKRIIVLNGEPLGAVLRVPSEEEHRGNIHVGGRCVRTEITARDREICEALAPLLRQDGLYFAGLDVIGSFLTEVNVTSPTGIQEINALDGVRLETQVVDFIESRARALRAEDLPQEAAKIPGRRRKRPPKRSGNS
ncbi:MAG TPA: glutathione synthase [candidate division Zixibacteria bacterium]|nr:glutathione synthase [candidate division Zixibacteria bacterium]